MEKYVLPQNNNSDFKFPASDLPLQQPSLNPQCLSWPTRDRKKRRTGDRRTVAFFAVSGRHVRSVRTVAGGA